MKKLIILSLVFASCKKKSETATPKPFNPDCYCIQNEQYYQSGSWYLVPNPNPDTLPSVYNCDSTSYYFNTDSTRLYSTDCYVY